MADRKTALTFEEKITAAWAHYVHGVDQHVIAAIMGVNQGRISEACSAARKAFGDGSVQSIAQLMMKGNTDG